MNERPDLARDLEAMAVMTDAPIQIRDVVDDWMLITFDIPKSEEGDKVRSEFLKSAWLAGAVQHTESVYLMPWTDDANMLVLNLSDVKGATVVVWHTRPADPSMALELTVHYDQRIHKAIEEVQERTDRIASHITGGRFKTAGNMAERSLEMLKSLEVVLRRRGSQELLDDLNRVRRDVWARIAEAYAS